MGRIVTMPYYEYATTIKKDSVEWMMNKSIPLILIPNDSKFNPPALEGGPRHLNKFLGKRKYDVIL